MELIEVPCSNCHNALLIQEDYVRDPIFCTIGCMNSFKEEKSSKYMRH